MAIGTAEKTNQDADNTQAGVTTSPVNGTGLDGGKGGANTKPEKTYKQSEVDALLGRAGQKIQAKLDTVTGERDEFKTKVETLTSEITEAKDSIESLTKDIETMSEDDPDKKGLLKLRREKEAELKTLRADKARVAEKEKDITQWQRDRVVFTVAGEFVTASGAPVDLDSFKKAADTYKIDGRDGLEELASVMGFKPKPETTETPAPVTPGIAVYSGKSEGGGDSLARLAPVDQIKEAERRLANQTN